MTTKLLILGIVCGAVIAVLTRLVRALTPGGAVAAFFIIAGSLYFGGYACFAVLLFTFALVSVAGKIVGARTAALTNGLHEKSGARDGVQVFANGFPALVTAVLCGITGNAAFAFAYTAAVAEALGDSLASDIGVLSKKAPVDICTFRPAVRGLSGAVSPLGTLSAVVGILLTAGFSMIFLRFSGRRFLLLCVLPFAGVLFDSVLGSRFQCRRQCTVCGKPTEKKVHCDHPTAVRGGIRFLNNDAVNLISNAVTAAVAAWLFCIL